MVGRNAEFAGIRWHYWRDLFDARSHPAAPGAAPLALYPGRALGFAAPPSPADAVRPAPPTVPPTDRPTVCPRSNGVERAPLLPGCGRHATASHAPRRRRGASDPLPLPPVLTGHVSSLLPY